MDAEPDRGRRWRWQRRQKHRLHRPAHTGIPRSERKGVGRQLGGSGRDRDGAPESHDRARGAGDAAPAQAQQQPQPQHLTAAEASLRRRILSHVHRCGFVVGEDGSLRLPRGVETGAAYRRVQRAAKLEQVARRAGDMLRGRTYEDAVRHCPDGSSIDPARIDLEIRMLPRGAHGREADLFRWWNRAWWSMPWQPSYGRRLRYFLWDAHHDAPFGLVVLQSPLLRMAARDMHAGIGADGAELHANMSMSAQRVGALPPYNRLIGGKMAALSLVCNEVRAEYAERYGGKRTVMAGRTIDPRLLFVTTTAAFGRSAMYDRLTYRGKPAGTMAGWTRGGGTFHLPDDITRGLYGVLESRGIRASATYGHGPSAKMRLCREALGILGLPGMQMHGLRRAVYVFDAASNVRDVIGSGAEPAWHDRPLVGAAEWWMARWCRGRAQRRDDWKRFKASAFFDGLGREEDAAARMWSETERG